MEIVLKAAYLAALIIVSGRAFGQDDFTQLVGGLKAQRAAIVPWRPAPADAARTSNPWSRVKAPSRGPAEAIGAYTSGCLRGALTLSQESADYQVMRPSRNRFHGHPDLVDFLADLSGRSRELGVVLVGDMAQPRGGPTMSNHVSHQTGLDVDVWYLMLSPGKTLAPEERESLAAPNMVVPEFEGLEKDQWDPKIIELLRFAAEAPRVQRILVNPVIKREVCTAYPGQAWVAKLRPWWGHDDHFHARLLCPEGSPRCEAQEPIPAGDGCGAELSEWFTPEKKRQARERRPQPLGMPKLPKACDGVLAESGL